MDVEDRLTEAFEASRPHLRSVAYRMLGSSSEADDAVQETWLRLSRSDAAAVENLPAWLTTVVGRVSLDMLRSRTTRREEPLELRGEEPATSATDPEQAAVLTDSIGAALLVVLDTLTPTERLAFVLHDLFAVSFDDVAIAVGRTPAAARQLASRARRRVQAGSPTGQADHARRKAIVDAFLTAARGGDMTTLLALLDPDVVLRVDQEAARFGSIGDTHGAEVVARFFAGRAHGAIPAEIDAAVGLIVAFRGQPRLAVEFIIAGDRIIGLDAVANRNQLAALDISPQ